MAGFKFQVTSANNGTQVPSAGGVLVRGPFDFYAVNGTTLSATLQMQSGFGNWVEIPDRDSRAALTGAAAFPVSFKNGKRIRLDVTTATGTWDIEAEEWN